MNKQPKKHLKEGQFGVFFEALAYAMSEVALLGFVGYCLVLATLGLIGGKPAVHSVMPDWLLLTMRFIYESLA